MSKRKQPSLHYYKLHRDKVQWLEKYNEGRLWYIDRKFKNCFNCKHYGLLVKQLESHHVCRKKCKEVSVIDRRNCFVGNYK